MAKRKILKDHKVIGKKLVPPMIHMMDGKLQETDFTNDTLPEILWMGLICQEIGYKQGIELISNFTECAKSYRNDEDYLNFTIANNFNKLSKEEKVDLSYKLNDKGIYEELKYLLAPLNEFYIDSPFTFLGKEAELNNEEKQELLTTLKTCLNNHFDRFKIDSLRILAILLYIKGRDGKIFYPQDMEVPDIELLFHNPDLDSDDVKSAMAHVRNTARMELMINYDNTWSKSFWNQSYKLDNCEF